MDPTALDFVWYLESEQFLSSRRSQSSFDHTDSLVRPAPQATHAGVETKASSDDESGVWFSWL